MFVLLFLSLAVLVAALLRVTSGLLSGGSRGVAERLGSILVLLALSAILFLCFFLGRQLVP